MNVFKYTCYLIPAILPQLPTLLAFTKITSIMEKLTKTQLFNQLKDRSNRNSFIKMGIINSIKVAWHAETLNDFKCNLIHELDRLKHIKELDHKGCYSISNEYDNDLFNRYVWYLGEKQYYRISKVMHQIKSLYLMANYVGYNILPRIGGHDLIAK